MRSILDDDGVLIVFRDVVDLDDECSLSICDFTTNHLKKIAVGHCS